MRKNRPKTDHFFAKIQTKYRPLFTKIQTQLKFSHIIISAWFDPQEPLMFPGYCFMVLWLYAFDIYAQTGTWTNRDDEKKHQNSQMYDYLTPTSRQEQKLYGKNLKIQTKNQKQTKIAKKSITDQSL